MTERDPTTRTEGETLDLPEELQGFAVGQVLGERYQILEMLGRGGMGEVWHAFDLKLRVEVALKALRPEFFKSERRLELLRQEVRAAREVMSPNVCRIFDLIEVEGRELVSMEYVDGATLLGVLHERGPLELKEAQDIASQFLAGLEAIHKVGLIHRDIKPENIMLTRAGRVVVMDFGLARQEAEGGGTVSGTPAYMAPEQAAGQTLDARADVYAAGVVLAEMVSPDGIKSFESRQSIWEGVRSEPAKVPDSPWAPVIKKAVAKEREGRFNSAHTLTRALEDVTLRVKGAEDLHPYPGLASFTEKDAEYFFGREAEVEQMWRKLEGPPRMLGLVGPSGAGKSSFIGAGVLANAPAGWASVVCTPGNAAISSLGRVIAREMAGDPDMVEKMMDFDDPDVAVEVLSRWCGRSERALLIIDQFEELFTLNSTEEQRRFAELLNQLVLEADIGVVLSMRDDFLMRCRDQESLQPIFSDMTAIPTLSGAALRRALVQPATKCGYRFEDEHLVDEMLAEVEGELGALPLLAFAAARLWERRDRETGLLTHQAYQEIGGVGGALAQHAEATIDRIGSDKIDTVREIFRNLVTAEGTRAVREWGELLSVFDDSQREPAEDVLRELIDARLLTSYEVKEEDREPTRRVEIIHESLLANWPRLARWQTQDADSARLRDELRRAARSWEEHGRSNDYLWTGQAFREYSVWRESYPGGLSELEEEFSGATIAHARRQKNRRRLATAAAFIALLVVLAIVGVSRQQAIAEANRAAASNLIALGHFVLEADRTEALAYAIASLERSDTFEARRLALRALWAGPPVTVLPVDGRQVWGVAVSPDGSRIAAGDGDGLVRVFPREGGARIDLRDFQDGNEILSFSPDGRLLLAGSYHAGGDVRVWESESWQLKRVLKPPEPPETLVDEGGFSFGWGLGEPGLPGVLTVVFQFEEKSGMERSSEFGHWVLRRWPLDGGPSRLIGEAPAYWSPGARLHLARGLLAVGMLEEIYLHRLETLGREPPRLVGRHSKLVDEATFGPAGQRLASCDSGGTIRIWPIDGDGRKPEREFQAPGFPGGTSFSPDGSLLAHASRSTGGWLWDLDGPARAAPLRFGAKAFDMTEIAFTPDGRWLVTGGRGDQPYRLAVWPMSDRYPRVLRAEDGAIDRTPVLFHPDGSRVFVTINEEDGAGALLSWPLIRQAGLEPVVLFRDANILDGAVDPHGRFLILNSSIGNSKIPLDGGAPEPFEGIGLYAWGLKIDPTGRYLASGPDRRSSKGVEHVLDLETGERIEVELPGEGESTSFFFDASGQLVVTRGGVVSRWNPETRATEVLVSEGVDFAYPLGDGRRLSVWSSETQEESILDLENGSRTALPQAHQTGSDVDIDAISSIVATSHPDGKVLVGRLSSEEPHVLLGHEPGRTSVWLSPDGRWIASVSSGDGTLRLWPMPDLSKPPLHTLPHDELMARLKALTNMRAVADPESSTGYKIEADFTAYHGWAEVPEW